MPRTRLAAFFTASCSVLPPTFTAKGIWKCWECISKSQGFVTSLSIGSSFNLIRMPG